MKVVKISEAVKHRTKPENMDLTIGEKLFFGFWAFVVIIEGIALIALSQ